MPVHRLPAVRRSGEGTRLVTRNSSHHGDQRTLNMRARQERASCRSFMLVDLSLTETPSLSESSLSELEQEKDGGKDGPCAATPVRTTPPFPFSLFLLRFLLRW